MSVASVLAILYKLPIAGIAGVMCIIFAFGGACLALLRAVRAINIAIIIDASAGGLNDPLIVLAGVNDIIAAFFLAELASVLDTCGFAACHFAVSARSARLGLKYAVNACLCGAALTG